MSSLGWFFEWFLISFGCFSSNDLEVHHTEALRPQKRFLMLEATTLSLSSQLTNRYINIIELLNMFMNDDGAPENQDVNTFNYSMGSMRLSLFR